MSGFFKRLIGKFAGSDLGKKIIGKTARAAHTVIGKAERLYHGVKKSLPSGIQDSLNSLENDVNFAKDTKASYASAKAGLDSIADNPGIASDYIKGHYRMR